MHYPFFSIVIPTRNRPELFTQTLLSVINQDFRDFEIIVSDNSTDRKTEQVFSTFGSRENISYYRPEVELSMPDHWEFATLKAIGQFVIILTDRSVLMSGALSSIYKGIEGSNRKIDICSWGWDVFDDSSKLLSSPSFTAKPTFEHADKVLGDFIAVQREYPYFLPRGLNSCYSSCIAESVRNKFGRLFFSINPDYHSAFLLLSFAEGTLYLNQSLFISHGLGVSNGGSGYLTDASAYLASLGGGDWFELVPMKSPLIENIIYADYLSVAHLVSRNFEWDMVEYFLRTYRELLDKRSAGLISSEKLQAFFQDWDQALRLQDLGIQSQVVAGVTRLERRRRQRRTLFFRSISWMHRKFFSGKVSKRFSGVMSAAGYTDFSPS